MCFCRCVERSGKMCEIQKLRALVEQILTAAAEEIFGAFKRSIAEIEEKLSDSPKHNKRNQRPPDALHQTDILIPAEQQGRSPYVDQEDPEPPHIEEDQEEEWISQEGEQKLILLSECPTLIQKLWMVKEELERSPSLDQVDPEPPHVKEEEDLWTNQEGEQLQSLDEAHITKFPSTPPHAKSEYDEDNAQSSQHHQSETENTEEPEDGDNYGESEPNSIQNKDFPISDVACKTTQHRRTEDDKTCTFSSVLETHMTVNTKKKRFNCSVCNKGFTWKFEVKLHMPVHTKERPFSCSVCKKCFAHKSNLKEHMSVHTGEKPFCCSVCKKYFAHKNNLRKHMSVHTGERPFCCSVCKKCFTYKHNLKRHMLTHTGKKTFIH